MNNKPKYKWYDPIIDPPIERNPEEYYQNNKTKFIGSAIGAGVGIAAAAAPYVQNHWSAEKTPVENIGKHMSRAGVYTLAGASIGNMVGNVVANYGTYKRRYDKNQEIHTQEELRRKMDLNLGPSFKVNAGPASFQY